MVGWHHRLDGHEFVQALGDGEGQGSLACCSPWGRKESDTTEQLNNNKNKPRSGCGCPPPVTLVSLRPLGLTAAATLGVRAVTRHTPLLPSRLTHSPAAQLQCNNAYNRAVTYPALPAGQAPRPAFCVIVSFNSHNPL